MNQLEYLESLVLGAKEGKEENIFKIIEQLKPLRIKLENKYNFLMDKEDIDQISILSILIAIKKYEIGRNTFFSYVKLSMINNINYTFRNKMYSLEVPSLIFEYSRYTDVTSEDIALYNIESTELLKALSKLDAIEREVLLMYYYEDMAYSDIGRIYNMNYYKLKQLMIIALDKLNKILYDKR